MVWIFLAFLAGWYGYSLRSKRGGMDIPCILMNKNDLPYRRDRDSLDFLYPRASQTCPRVKKIQAVPLSSIRYIPDSVVMVGMCQAWQADVADGKNHLSSLLKQT